MISFAQLWEEVDKEKNARRSPLMDSGEDEASVNAARVGKDMHGEDETPFWDEFISLCSNADGLASLLGVSREKVTGWPNRIREVLEKVEARAGETPDRDQREMVPTGDNGAFMGNQDPNLGDLKK